MAEQATRIQLPMPGWVLLCARTAVEGAYLNVRINAAGLDETAYRETVLAEAKEIEVKAKAKAEEILEIVGKKDWVDHYFYT